MIICEKNMCTGCGACANICSKHAIQMVQDNKGFFYPEIDVKQCTKCGLCKKICSNNNVINVPDIDIKPYAAWNKKLAVRESSSSGGVFTLLAEAILNEGGIVAGVIWDSDFHPKHCIIQEKENIKLLWGSKYVQSNCGNIYTDIKYHLECGKKVLFSGTPCQAHALKLYLRKEYEGLYIVDLICHGVPPVKMFDRYLSERNEDKKKITSINLRFKKPSWSYSSVNIRYSNGKGYTCPTVSDPYFNLFNFNYSLRNCCHHCRYTNLERQGDITLADFWGYYPEGFRMRNYDHGVSCVIVNSHKGEQLFETVKSGLALEQSNIDKVIRGNQCLEKPFAAPENVDSFWNDYLAGMSIDDLNQKYVIKPYIIPRFQKLRRMKRKYYWIWNKLIKK